MGTVPFYLRGKTENSRFQKREVQCNGRELQKYSRNH